MNPWQRRGWLLIVVPYLLIVAVATWAGVQYQHSLDIGCHRQRDDRTALRALVVKAYQPSSPGLDLATIQGFDELDPATQSYLRNLSAAINAGGNTANREQDALATIPPITC